MYLPPSSTNDDRYAPTLAYGAPAPYAPAPHSTPAPYGAPAPYGPAPVAPYGAAYGCAPQAPQPMVQQPVPAYPAPGHPVNAGYLATTAPKPSGGGAARFAGVLALLGAVHMGVLLAATLDAGATGTVTGRTLAGLLLLAVGGILLLARKKAGRVLVILGCLQQLAAWVIGAVVLRHHLDVLSAALSSGDPYQLGWALSFVAALVFPVLTLILALSGSTRRWLAA